MTNRLPVGIVHGQKGNAMNTREKLNLIAELERSNNERIIRHIIDNEPAQHEQPEPAPKPNAIVKEVEK